MERETLAEEIKALREILKQNNKAILDKLKKAEQRLKELEKKKAKPK